MRPKAVALELRKNSFREPISFFKVRYAREDELLDAEFGVSFDLVRNLRVAADQGGTGAAAHQTEASPEIGLDFEVRGGTPVQGKHAFLALPFAAGETSLNGLDRLGIDGGEQTVGLGPRRFSRVAGDDVKADTETHGAALGFGQRTNAGDLLGDGRGRFTPREIHIDVAGGDGAGAG